MRKTLLALVLTTAAFVVPAQAKTVSHHSSHLNTHKINSDQPDKYMSKHRHHNKSSRRAPSGDFVPVMFGYEAGLGHGGGYQEYSNNYSTPTQYSGSVGGRPSAWCGWEMRQLVGNDPGPAYNLARNWSHWGRPGPLGVGAVVVWPHHVGKIVGQENGQWIIQSGNDGHAVRTRPRSVAGVIAVRWG